MTIHDRARAALEKVYDDALASLTAAAEVERGEANQAKLGLASEKANHETTRGLLATANARIAQQDSYIQELLDRLAAEEPNLYDPISFDTLEEAIDVLGAPVDGKYVTWRWTDDVMLEQAFMEMAPDEILVLPERDKPYLIDSADGFRAAGVKQLINGDGATPIPIKNTYRGKNARTWFAMARARRGIIGLGPNARIEIAPSSFKMGQQAPQGKLKYVNTNNQTIAVSDASMRLIETDAASSFYANFTIVGRDLGGVAYSAIGSQSGVAKRIRSLGASRGFLSAPNGETGVLTFNGRYVIENIEISGRDPVSGKRVSTTPIMINSSPGGSIKDVFVHESFMGAGVSIWNSSGKHTAQNLRVEAVGGVNLEANRAGFEFEWDGGTNYADYKKGEAGRNDRPEYPDRMTRPQGNTSLHFGVRSPYGSQKVTIRGVEFDQGPWPGTISIQSYWGENEARLQKAADFKAFDRNGNPVPVRFTEGGLATGV